MQERTIIIKKYTRAQTHQKKKQVFVRVYAHECNKLLGFFFCLFSAYSLVLIDASLFARLVKLFFILCFFFFPQVSTVYVFFFFSFISFLFNFICIC